MAGFVPEDHGFTKGKQNIEDQQRNIAKAFYITPCACPSSFPKNGF